MVIMQCLLHGRASNVPGGGTTYSWHITIDIITICVTPSDECMPKSRNSNSLLLSSTPCFFSYQPTMNYISMDLYFLLSSFFSLKTFVLMALQFNPLIKSFVVMDWKCLISSCPAKMYKWISAVWNHSHWKKHKQYSKCTIRIWCREIMFWYV